jgi:hypothetical protein
MAVQNNVYVTEDLLAAMQNLAAQEGRTSDELFEEAGRRYLAHQRLSGLAARGFQSTSRVGIKEDDVDRLVQESRASLRADAK